MHSTSFHQLNADRGLSAPGKAAYFALNWLRNQWRPAAADPSLVQCSFRCELDDADWARLGTGTTPTRRLSDLFWLKLPWSDIERELGTIQVFDTGCGDGRYATKLDDYSGGRIAGYTGIDARRRADWNELGSRDARFSFLEVASTDIAPLIPPQANLLITQSAIEHFDEDLGFFETLRDHAAKAAGPVLQAHLLPSRACLWLYLFHGVRQYTPRGLSPITRLFTDFSDCRLFALGGRHCNALHWSTLTRPSLGRGGDDLEALMNDDYERALRAAVEADLRDASEPSFYALVIHSKPNTPLFD
ncbi:MAG: hypothetical protein ACQGVC_20860 [Myxococcota bacterium]